MPNSKWNQVGQIFDQGNCNDCKYKTNYTDYDPTIAGIIKIKRTYCYILADCYNTVPEDCPKLGKEPR